MGLIPWRNKQDLSVRKEQGDVYPALSDFRKEMDQLFENFFRNTGSFFDRESFLPEMASWAPSLDMSEDEKQLKVAVEVPGIDPKDVDISLSGNLLTIRGEKREENEDKSKDFFRSERRFGSFVRSVELPHYVDSDSVTADYKNGLLTVTAKKTSGGDKKKIPILGT